MSHDVRYFKVKHNLISKIYIYTLFSISKVPFIKFWSLVSNIRNKLPQKCECNIDLCVNQNVVETLNEPDANIQNKR